PRKSRQISRWLQKMWGLVTMTRDDGKPVDMEQIDADPGLGNWLRMRCEELLDDR
ncbi:hypothetical protein BOX15_Mlig000048g3, partial [Macrostomum lignano]